MPHVIVKLWPGRTEEQKYALSKRITDALKETMEASDSSISIAIEEVPKLEWKNKVYDPEIMAKKDILYKEPGYKPPEKN
jgi:4-oxalocrotonate tautomerase